MKMRFAYSSPLGLNSYRISQAVVEVSSDQGLGHECWALTDGDLQYFDIKETQNIR